MQLFRGFDNIQNIDRSLVAVGSFDGVHRGHRLLIDTMNRTADQINVQPVVVTFDPHPRMVLKGENKLLSTLDEKLFLLEEAGARNVVVVHFDKQFSQTPYDTFVRDMLIAKLKMQAMFVGEGNHIGRNKEGNAQTLKDLGIEVYYLPRYDEISSTMVRQAINRDDMLKAVELLGAPYLVAMPVADSSKLLPATPLENNKNIRIINLNI